MKGRVFLISWLLIASAAQGLTLNDSVDLALRQNPAVREAYQGTAQAAGRLSQASTSFLPSLKLDGSIGKSYSQPQTVQIAPGTYMTFGTSDQADVSRYNFTLSQPVFLAALFPGYNLARKNYDLARENLRKVAQETVYNTIVAYANVIRAQKLADLSEQSLNMAKSHLNQAQIMFNAGVTPKADLLRNQVQVLNAEVTLTKARSGLDIAESSFNNVLGRSPGQMVEVDEKELERTPLALPDYEKLSTELFKSRPDWQQLILSEEMARDSLTVARTEYFPSFMLVGNYGNTKTEYPSYRSDVNSWTAVVSGSWSLINLPTAGKVAEAQAVLAAQLARRENVKNGLELELRSAYYELKAALETIGLTQKAVESAEENYKVSEVRYNAGAGTNLESLDAQVALTQARINHLQARFDLEIARAKINKVVGKEVL